MCERRTSSLVIGIEQAVPVPAKSAAPLRKAWPADQSTLRDGSGAATIVADGGACSTLGGSAHPA